MKPSKGDDLEHPVTELEAVRSILVQGLPLLDQELTESSIVQVNAALYHINLLLYSKYFIIFASAAHIPYLSTSTTCTLTRTVELSTLYRVQRTTSVFTLYVWKIHIPLWADFPCPI